MKRAIRSFPLALVLALGSHAYAEEPPPSFDAYLSAAPVQASAPARTPSGRAAGFVASVDELRGVPAFFWAAPARQALPAQLVAAGPERLARAYLEQNAATYGLSRAALRTAYVKQVHDTGRGGVIVVFGQKIGGVEVFEDEMKILMNRAGDLVAIGGNLHAAATPGSKGTARTFKLRAAEAVAAAFEDLYGIAVAPSDMIDTRRESAGYRYFRMRSTRAVRAQKLAFNRPARARKVFYPMPDRIVPAYYLELDVRRQGTTTSDMFGYVIAADTGDLLARRNLTQDASFNYRVWAQSTAPFAPLEGPHANYTPHPTGTPDGSSPAFVLPGMIAMDGFNTSPNGTPDPWLGAAATQTNGNNCDAYADLSAPDGMSGGDLRATTTSASTFDRTYDTAQAPQVSNDQIRASVTQLFYTVNWMHDYWYDSGFDEAAGNAQASNYGRGGAEGDALYAEAQDYNGLNNANMSTPADGAHPRMQMFLWDGAASSTLDVQPINLSPASQAAAFGPQSFNITAQLILGQDGNAPSGGNPDIHDGCQNLINNVAGKIVLVHRGDCTFEEKVQRAQNAGAVGVLISNNVAQGLPPMGDDNTIPAGAVTIGSLGIGQADGATLEAALLNQTLTVTMARAPAVQRDGTIDNAIVAHEWGHYIHHRLVACSTDQCSGESEGWGDVNALLLAIEDGEDVATGTFALSIYSNANYGDEGYFGIRRFPYSRDTTKNGLTFKHVTDGEPLPAGPNQDNGYNNWEVHNAGEIWAQMVFQAYTGLILNGGHPFAEAKRRMADYIVAGMKMAPVNPTITEQRDGILAAAAAADPNDFVILAQGFADRGAGTCAVSPPRTSTTGSGVVEDFMLSGNQAFVELTANDAIVTCDADGVLDAEETGQVLVEVLNTGAGALTNTTVTLTTAAAGVTFPNGNTGTIASIAPFSTGVAAVDVALDSSFTAISDIDFTVAMTNAAACTPTVQSTASLRVNYDETLQSSATDTVESPGSPWAKWSAPAFTGLADDVWSRNRQANGNYRWYGQNYPAHSDTAIESPDLVVSANQPLVITFAHAYDFEASFQMGQWTYWDGGLIEITKDGGQTWQDVSMYSAPGYNGTIAAVAGADNPLGNRQGYVRRNAAWPNTNTVTLNMGNAFAGQTVRLRFRVGTDALEGVPNYQGWYIDDIAVQGITNTPFPTVVPDPVGCDSNNNTPPVADAGPDMVVTEGFFVPLNGSMSSDADQDPLTYAWAQTAGPSVTLANASTATPSFTAPLVSADTTLIFELTVDDGMASSVDSVDVLVLNLPDGTTSSTTTGTGGMGGIGGMGTGGMGTGGMGTGGMGTGGIGTGGMGTGGMGTGGIGTGGMGTGGMGTGGIGTGGIGTGGMGTGGIGTGGMGTGGMGTGGIGTGGAGGGDTGGMGTGGVGGTGGSDAGGTGGTGGPITPEGGCGCITAGSSTGPSGSTFAPLLFAAALWLRKRNRRKS